MISPFSKRLSWAIAMLLFNKASPVHGYQVPVGVKSSATNTGSSKKENKLIKKLSDALKKSYIYSTDIQTQFNLVKQAQEECFKARADWMPNINFGLDVQGTPTKGFNYGNVGTTANVVEDYYSTKSNTRRNIINFTLAQNLYNGGATKAKNEFALESYRIAWCDFKIKMQATFMDVVNNFVDAAVLREFCRINKDREKSLSVLCEVARNRSIAGDIRISDFSLAKAQYIDMSKEVTNSKKDYLEKKYIFEYITGCILSEEDIEFPEPLEIDIFSVETLINLCFKFNPIWKKQKHAEYAARCKVKLSAANFLPRMDFRVQGNFQDAYQYEENSGMASFPTRTSNKGVEASISVSMPIFDGGTISADYRQTELQSKGVRLESESQKRDLIRQCKTGLKNYQTALQNVASAREAQKERAVCFASAREEYALGQTSMIDLLGLEDQYANSIKVLITALADLVKASYELKRLSGQLTPDMLHITSKNYNINNYREAFKVGLYSLGKNQSKEPLYEKDSCDHSDGGSDVLRSHTDEALLLLKSALKEGIDWYPNEGIVLKESNSKSVEDAHSNILEQLLSGHENDTSMHGKHTMDIEALMNASLDELAGKTQQKSEKKSIEDVSTDADSKEDSSDKLADTNSLQSNVIQGTKNREK